MLRYGVLGLLIERRAYGYQLVQRLSKRLGPAWQLNPSAVYGALDQLEEAGLIAAVPDAGLRSRADRSPSDRPPRRAARVVYEPTGRGVEEFESWLARPGLRTDPIRSEIRLKISLADPDTVPALLASIEHERLTVMRRLEEERQAAGAAPDQPSGRMRASNGQADVDATPDWCATAMELVNAAAVTRLRGELTWLELAHDTLRRKSKQHLITAAAAGGGRIDPPDVPISS